MRKRPTQEESTEQEVTKKQGFFTKQERLCLLQGLGLRILAALGLPLGEGVLIGGVARLERFTYLVVTWWDAGTGVEVKASREVNLSITDHGAKFDFAPVEPKDAR